MANGLAFCRVANAHALMERVSGLVSYSGLFQNPLMISLREQEARENRGGCQ